MRSRFRYCPWCGQLCAVMPQLEVLCDLFKARLVVHRCNSSPELRKI